MSFNAVVTTGIYCRDGCAGRPDASNVTTYEYAAAAESQGFRPCLRCRPYRSSEPGAWIGTSELVCRAVRLVLDGALDEGDEEALGRRLGVSGRHLRRLFSEHVGATPDALARSRRAHFARRLLDDTDLPVSRIAFAAGFGSVRQMNREMRRIFHAPPADLRARRRKGDRLVADGGFPLRLPYRDSLDWTTTTRFLAARAVPGVETVDGDAYRRTILVEGLPGVVEMAPGDDGHLVLVVHLPRWEGLIHLVERARRVFDLDADLGTVTTTLRRDPDLRQLVDRRPGLRVPKGWDPLETAVRVLLGQQVTVAGASTLAGRFVERFGRPVGGLDELGLSHVFPDAATVAEAGVEAVGVPRARARAVRALARRYAEGALPLDGSIGLDDVVALLCDIDGVGPWSAHMIAMRACGEPDAFPAGDLGLRRRLGNGTAVASRLLTQRAEAWRPWRAYAAMHLWAA